ncbi:unnamed protein product [Fraxinus pennsylvanica]|uniref:Uncharacterized protein n=1 Tax=Fraxinus pennsylvanica TaxID=56036 RepID=A0AAD1ZQR1_9LAMI|nr:unnamed protein product [Fraxinus pennsylvanica]
MVTAQEYGADIVQPRSSPVTGSFSRDLSLEADVSESNAGADPEADQTVPESDGNNTVAVYGDVNSNSQDCLHNHYIKLSELVKNRKLNDLLDSLDFNQVVIFVKSVNRAAELNKLLLEYSFGCGDDLQCGRVVGDDNPMGFWCSFGFTGIGGEEDLNLKELPAFVVMDPFDMVCFVAELRKGFG